MVRLHFAGVVCLIALLLGRPAPAQDADRPAMHTKLIDRFDADGDGRLDADERKALRRFLTDLRGEPHKPLPQKLLPGEAALHKFARGPHTIGELAAVDLLDPDRDKIIPLRIAYPKEGGPYPLIIFCHGALGSKDGGDPMAHHWASHGYVVVRPTFGDSLGNLTAEQKANIQSIKDLVNSPHVMSQWDQRPRDVSHVIDSLPSLVEQLDELKGKVDVRRIAVAGHSFGAHTTMLIAGLTVTDPRSGKAFEFRDKRVSATVMISPQGPTAMITPESYRTMAGPMLMITGDHDGSPVRGREGKSGKWRAEAFEHVPPGDKYLLWIHGAHHGFGGINGKAAWPGAGPASPDQVALVNTTALAMFDAYLKADAEAKAYLTARRVDTESAGLAELMAK
jgi:predicted dienelactone hydrolase